LLDLFCGAGGAAMGYHRAGFEVVGVDIEPQPRYPFHFVQADALSYVREWGYTFAAIHASPPCQAYSTATRDYTRHPDLYEPTRNLLLGTGLPWVIENVIGAPYSSGVVLCGSMFGLEADGEWLQRHRNFETSWLLMQPEHRHTNPQRAITVTGKSYLSETRTVGRHSRQGTFALAKRLMDVGWMTRKELSEAIPPAYTEWVGHHLMEQL
jgi:DNA (cytosine-5)-methyltransferase 1